MKAHVALCLSLFAALLYARGQTTHLGAPPAATMCDLYQDPEKYAGKLVSVRASVTGNDLWIDTFTQERCPAWTKVVVEFPANRDELVKDRDFQTFFDELKKGRHVDATFEGRFDVAYVWRDKKQVFIGGERKGYGKKRDAGARLVLHRVSEVTSLQVSRK